MRMRLLAAVVSAYVSLVLTYALLQRRFAHFGRRGQARKAEEPQPYQPDVDVIIPCYNEEPALLADCLRSLRTQDYRGQMNVWVVDDGSSNLDALRPVLEAEAHPAWHICYIEGNQGKRVAQDAALREGRSKIVLTIDSDTTIDQDGVRRIVAPLRDARVGAVTGDVRPSNPEATWLTRLIDTRYRLLFERERAAQGFFGAVICCAGPFSAYRRAVVERVWGRYIGQRFWGGRRVSGDDLKLTNLVLAEGYRSVYEPQARAATNVPASLRMYVRQQVRWNRSFYRELPQILRLLRGRSRFLTLDIAGQTLLPLLVAVGLGAASADALGNPSALPRDLGALAFMALATGGLTRSHGPDLRFAVGYGAVFILLLLPTRFWAVCTLFENRWGTRTLQAQRRVRSSSLRTLRSATLFPFCLYR
jgi:N-acetylglucosaminyltransferase